MSSFVGRVGALAVALGVGIALVTTPAVAVAEPGVSESDNGETDNDADPSDGGADPSTTDTGSQDTNRDEDVSPEKTAEIPSESDDVALGDDQGDEAPPTELDALHDAEPLDANREPPTPTAPITGEGLDTQLPAATPNIGAQGVTPAVESGPRQDEPLAYSTTAAEASPDSRSEPDTTSLVLPNSSAAPVEDGAALGSPEMWTALYEDTSPTQESTVSALRLTPAQQDSAAPTPTSTIGEVLSALLAPLLVSTGPAAPVQSPILWAVLAWVRRQFEHTFANKTAVILDNHDTQLVDVNTVAGTVSASDPDPEDRVVLTYTGGDPDARITIDPSGAWTYTAPVNWDGTSTHTDTFTITATEQRGGLLGLLSPQGRTVTTTVSVTLAPTSVSRPPVAVDDRDSTLEDTQATGNVLANDNDIDTPASGLTVTTQTATTQEGGTITFTPNGNYTYTPAANFAGTDTVEYTMTDGTTTDTATLTITVSRVETNHAPTDGTFDIDVVEVSAGTVTGRVIATDEDGDTLTFSGPSNTTKGTVVVTAEGGFTYKATDEARAAATKPVTTADLEDSFTVLVTDGNGGTLPVTVTVPITPLSDANKAPVIGEPEPEVILFSDGVTLGQVNVTDPDGDPLTYSLLGAPSADLGTVSVDPETGAWEFVPTLDTRVAAWASWADGDDDCAQAEFVIAASDGQATTPVTVRATIAPESKPVAGSTPFTITDTNVSTGTVSGVVHVTDADGDYLSYTLGTELDPAVGSVTVDPDTGEWTFTPTAPARHAAGNTAGVDTVEFTIVASDGNFDDQVTVTANIVPTTNTPPTAYRVISYDSATGVVRGTIYATDADRDPLTFAAPTHTDKGTIVVNPDGTFIYTPTATARHAAAANGASTAAKNDAFVITVSDGNGGAAQVPISVSVLGYNAPPVANGWSGSTDPTTGVVTGRLNVTDSDGDVLAYGNTYKTTKGTLTVNLNGTFTYTPTATSRYEAANGGATTDQIGVTVTDGHGGLISAPVRIDISPAVLDQTPSAAATLTGLQQVTRMEVGPDGKLYAVQQEFDPDRVVAHDRISIAVVDPDSGYLTETIPVTEIDYVSDILVAEDGRVFAVDTSGKVVTIGPVTHAETVLYNPAERPEYNQLAFGADEVLYVYGADGAQRINLTDRTVQQVTDAHVLAVAADGTLYTRTADGYSHSYGDQAHVTVIRPDGTATHVYGKFTASDYPVQVIVAPDGGAYVLWDGYNYEHIAKIDAAGNMGPALWNNLEAGEFGQADLRRMQLGADGNLYLTNTSRTNSTPTLMVIDPVNRTMSLTKFEPAPGFTENNGSVVKYQNRGTTLSTSRLVYQGLGTFAVGDNGTVYSYEEVINYSYALTPSEWDEDEYYWRTVSTTYEGNVRVSTVPGTGQTPPDVPTRIFTNPTSALYNHLRDVTGEDHAVVVEKVHGLDGQDRLVVYIGGTNSEVFGTNQSWLENFPKAVAGTLDPDITNTIDQAVAENPDLPIMLVGYSQGGIDAQNIAASGRYENVTSVVTFGTVVTKAPLAGTIPPIPSDVNVLHVIDENDPISYYFTNPVTLAENRSAGTVFMWRGGVIPNDPNLFLGAPIVNFPWGFINIHTDEATYENIGIEFDNPSVNHGEDYTEIKEDLNDFRGEVKQTWRSERLGGPASTV